MKVNMKKQLRKLNKEMQLGMSNKQLNEVNELAYNIAKATGIPTINEAIKIMKMTKYIEYGL